MPKCIKKKKAQEICRQHLDMGGLLQPLATSVPEEDILGRLINISLRHLGMSHQHISVF